MPKSIQLGNTNFKEAIDNKSLLVDKSLLIKEIIEDPDKAILITRPRRWGKTLNLSMIRHFFASEVAYAKTQGIFDGLKIAKETQGHYIKDHQGQYPVIFLTLKDVKAKNYSNFLEKIKNLIQDLYGEYKYLLSSSDIDSFDQEVIKNYLKGDVKEEMLQKSLLTLSKLLHLHHNKKVYILIDEYDSPLNSAYSNQCFEEITNFMRNLFSSTLKDNDHLQKGIMTGILRISKNNMLSGLNNLKVYSVLDKPYSPYFGFTDEELDALFLDQQLTRDKEKIKDLYNGYEVGGLTLYNPWSIMNSLKEGGALKPYWVSTADDSFLQSLLLEANVEIKTQFQSLLEGKSIEGLVSEFIRFEEAKQSETGLCSLLLYAGYLKATNVVLEDTRFRCQLSIPNKEVLAIYRDIFLAWLGKTVSDKQKKNLLKHLLQGDVKEAVESIEQFLTMAASVHDYSKYPEAFYHGFMLALTVEVMGDYYVDSNQESGFGRPDLLFTPKDMKSSQAIILEFKHVHKKEEGETIAQQALAQIDEQVYAAKIKQHDNIKTILKVGLAFDGKEVYYAHETSDLDKLFQSLKQESQEKTLLIDQEDDESVGSKNEKKPSVSGEKQTFSENKKREEPIEGHKRRITESSSSSQIEEEKKELDTKKQKVEEKKLSSRPDFFSRRSKTKGKVEKSMTTDKKTEDFTKK